ncbi:MAG TPA: CocE/NonD family hydrolase, partial [Frankiaceae bacterium]|nr:CocE/NonD family hydrolase [Frankiaceae bacterium]
MKLPPGIRSAVTSRALSRAFALEKLPPPVTRDLSIRRDVAVTMDDGVILFADHYAPRPLRLCADAPPVVLIRSPYGRRGALAAIYGRVIAERGFQVFLQSCRGTADSGGEFVPEANEQRDGAATVRWLRAQPWCDGRIASAGMSYLGYTQYATATAPGADIAAMALSVTMADLGEPTFATGSMTLSGSLGWARMMSLRSRRGGPLRLAVRRRELDRALDAVPLASGDRLAGGRTIGWYQDWLANPTPDAEYWRRQSHREQIGELSMPVSMLTGWHDLFLPWMLRDYAVLVAAGNAPELTIGPWSHTSMGHGRAIPATTITFLRERLLGDPPSRPLPVRIFVTGDDGGWRDLPAWPPPGLPEQWQLTTSGLLRYDSRRSLPAGERATFTFDPADPTPAVAGATLTARHPVVDNAAHEQRPDVVTYTSAALADAVTIAGSVTVQLEVSADNGHHDVFARLCDVDEQGRSWNVCDRMTRLTPELPMPG